MGGLNAADRLKASGIDAGKGTAIFVDPDDLFFPPEGHPLHDPRSLWPVDMGLVESIKSGQLKPVVTVRDDGIPKRSKKRRLTVIDGGRRSKALIWINEDGRESRKVEIVLVSGEDREMLLLRLRLNGHRRDETPSTLAYKFKQGEAAGIDLAELCKAYGCSLRLAEQVKRFPQCRKSVREAFDSGRLPLEVLGHFVDVPPEEQEEFLRRTLEKLPKDASGAAAVAGARKAVRGAKRAEKRVKTEKPAKSLPSAFLQRGATAATALYANMHTRPNEAAAAAKGVHAGLLYAAGKPEALRALDPNLLDALERLRKAKQG